MGDLSLISRLTQEIQSLKLNVLLLAFYFCYKIGLWLVTLKVLDLLKFVIKRASFNVRKILKDIVKAYIAMFLYCC